MFVWDRLQRCSSFLCCCSVCAFFVLPQQLPMGVRVRSFITLGVKLLLASFARQTSYRARDR